MSEKPLYGRRSKAALLAEGVGQRRHGEGSLFQTSIRGEKVWRASRVVKNPDGTSRKISGTGSSPAQATERLALNLEKYRQETAAGRPPIPKRKKVGSADQVPTFVEVAKEWLEWRKHYSQPEKRKEPLGIQSVNQYRLMIKNHFTDWGAQPITDYTKEIVREFSYRYLQQTNLSTSQQRGIQGVLYQVFDFGVERGYLKKDPAKNLAMTMRDKNARFAKVKSENLESLSYVPSRIMSYLQAGKTQDDFITDGKPDVERFKTYQRLSVYEARWAVSALLALRPAEVLGLTWDKITYLNLDARKRRADQTPRVAIVQQLARNPEQEGLGTKLYLKQNTKTASGERVLPLSDALVEILRDWQATQKEWKKSPDWAPYPHLSNLVFTTKTGKPIRQQNDNAAWRELLANTFRADDETSKHIRSLRLYALRHLAITVLIRGKTPAGALADIAGHSSVSLTYEVYGHLDISDMEEPLLALSNKTFNERKKTSKK